MKNNHVCCLCMSAKHMAQPVSVSNGHRSLGAQNTYRSSYEICATLANRMAGEAGQLLPSTLIFCQWNHCIKLGFRQTFNLRGAAPLSLMQLLAPSLQSCGTDSPRCACSS